jgi:hypothetical protein
MSEDDVDRPLDPRLADAFAALRAESQTPPRDEAVVAARRAMHLAVAERTTLGTLPRIAQVLRRAVTLHRVAAAAGGVAVGLAAVTALGWNAPAGTPLHVVQVTHEQIALSLPGADRASLDLGYAESRLAQAASGDSLDEAQCLLDDAHSHLPSDHDDALWTRWRNDSDRLDQLREQEHRGGGGDGDDGHGTTSTTTTTTTSTTASRSGEDGGGGSSSSSGEGGGSSTTSSSSSSSSTHSTSSTSTSSGGDGGRDGGSSSSTSSSSDGGSDGGGHH